MPIRVGLLREVVVMATDTVRGNKLRLTQPDDFDLIPQDAFLKLWGRLLPCGGHPACI